MNLQKEFQELSSLKFSSEVSAGHDNPNLKKLADGWKTYVRKELEKLKKK